MAQIKVSVVAYGFASLLVVLGVILLLVGYQTSNMQEVGSGWPLIALGVGVWALGFIARFARLIR